MQDRQVPDGGQFGHGPGGRGCRLSRCVSLEARGGRLALLHPTTRRAPWRPSCEQLIPPIAIQARAMWGVVNYIDIQLAETLGSTVRLPHGPRRP